MVGMADKKPKKVYLGTHVTLAGRQWLEDLAHTHHLTLSEVARTALAVAKRHENELVKALEERS